MSAVLAVPKASDPDAELDAIEADLSFQREFDPWTGVNGTARPEQLPPPGDWHTWLIMAGRGWGKTRTGAEFIRYLVQHEGKKRLALVAATAADAIDVMIEGESGLLAVCERAGIRVHFNPSKRRIRFPEYNAIATYYTAEKPRQLRGPQHDGFWADEIAAWKYPETWDMLQFTNRLGDNPRGCATTTPRPVKLIRELMEGVKQGVVALTKGSTYDNAANLAKSFVSKIITKYEGTRLGRQELDGELLGDVEGAMWSLDMIDAARIKLDPKTGRTTLPQMVRVAVAADPATTFGEDSDETGLAVAGLGADGDRYVFHISGQRVSPLDWATKALMLYDEFQADEIVYEANQGGEMVRLALVTACKDLCRKPPRIRGVTAKRGKVIRAEPIVLLYEQQRVHHVGTFPAAEDQMANFPVIEDAGDDMVDALVHALTAVETPRRRGPGIETF